VGGWQADRYAEPSRLWPEIAPNSLPPRRRSNPGTETSACLQPRADVVQHGTCIVRRREKDRVVHNLLRVSNLLIPCVCTHTGQGGLLCVHFRAV